MSGFYKGEKVRIKNKKYIDGTVGHIVDRVADFVYSVHMNIGVASWEEEFSTDELESYEDTRYVDFLKQRY